MVRESKILIYLQIVTVRQFIGQQLIRFSISIAIRSPLMYCDIIFVQSQKIMI